MTVAPVLSGQFFNLMYGRIFDSHSMFEGDGKGGGERVCPDGRQCYAGAYVFTLVASLLGVGWCFWCMREERRGLLGGREREREDRHVSCRA
jgi:hypothetical protein